MAGKDRGIAFDPATLTGPAKKIWLAGLGALATAETEGSKMFRTLVERGEELQGRGRERVEGLVGSVGERADSVRSDVGQRLGVVGDNMDELVLSAMRQLGVPSREELEILTRRIEELAESLESLQSSRTKPAGKKAPAKKAAGTTAKTSTTRKASSNTRPKKD